MSTILVVSFRDAGDSCTHRVVREDITIIILDTKLVPDFVLHACCFFIAGIRPVLKLPHSTNKSLSYENRGPKSLFVSDLESEMFFLITSEISKLGRSTSCSNENENLKKRYFNR